MCGNQESRGRIVLSGTGTELGASLAEAFSELGYGPGRSVQTSGLSVSPVEILALIPAEISNDSNGARRFDGLVADLFQTAREAIRGMTEQRRGKILTVVPPCSDAMSGFGSQLRSTMLAFSAALANELARFGITVTVGCPGDSLVNAPQNRKRIARAMAAQTIAGREFVTF